jgi:heat-inducible transcriptional repressor
MRERELSAPQQEFLRNIVQNNIRKMDELMRETAKAIALMTNYTTILTEPKAARDKVKYIQLMPYDDSSVLLTVVTSEKSVRNHAIKVHKIPDSHALYEITAILNGAAALDEDGLDELCDKYPQYAYLLEPAVQTVWESSRAEDESLCYTTGVKNLLTYPEFSDIRRAKELVQAIEEKKVLPELMSRYKDDEIAIIIGEESGLELMNDCSIIKFDCVFGGRNYGSIGIIGPKRMDYEQVVSLLNGVINKINEELNTGG